MFFFLNWALCIPYVPTPNQISKLNNTKINFSIKWNWFYIFLHVTTKILHLFFSLLYGVSQPNTPQRTEIVVPSVITLRLHHFEQCHTLHIVGISLKLHTYTHKKTLYSNYIEAVSNTLSFIHTLALGSCTILNRISFFNFHQHKIVALSYSIADIRLSYSQSHAFWIYVALANFLGKMHKICQKNTNIQLHFVWQRALKSFMKLPLQILKRIYCK